MHPRTALLSCMLAIATLVVSLDAAHEGREAEALATSWRGADKEEAVSAYRKLLERAREEGDADREAWYHVRLGDLHRHLSRPRRALPHYESAIHLGRHRPRVSAAAHAGLSRTLLRLDELDRGRDHAHRALELSRESGDGALEAYALVTLGIASFDAARLGEALVYLRQALVRSASESARAEALLHIGFTHTDRGEEWLALDAFGKSLALATPANERRIEAMALLGLGHTYSKIGEKQKALEHYMRARPILDDMGDALRSASLATGLGFLYTELGDVDNAERYFEDALRLNEAAQSRWGKVANLLHLGRIYSERDRLVKALRMFRSAITTLDQLPDRGTKPTILGEMANVLDRLGRHEEALGAYERALALSHSHGNERVEAEIRSELGRFDLRRGGAEQARTHFERALALSRRTDSRFTESRALFLLGRTARAEGKLDEALANVKLALEIVESLRTKISSYRLRASYVASVHEMQAFHVDLLMDLHELHPGDGFDRQAFLAAEVAKARSLLDVISESEHKSETGDPALRAYAERLRRELASGAATWEADRSATEDDVGGNVPSELRELVLELERVESVLRGGEMEGPALATSELAGVSELQRELLDGRTFLLSYFLGQERSYLWVVTRSRITVHRLPPAREIEAAVRNVYELLLATNDRAWGRSAKQRHERAVESERAFWIAAAPLGEILLGPAMREASASRFIVAGDGALHYLPFSALPLPDSGGTPVPAVARFEIVRLPSASTLKAIAQRSTVRRSSGKKLAVLADPVFDASDPRVEAGAAPRIAARAGTGSWSVETDLLRRAADDATGGGPAMPRLLSSRREATTILDLVPPDDRLQALGFSAARNLVESGVLSGYDVVHFATHGLLSTERPELSGIALSLVDRQGRAQNGFLRLHEIHRIDLPVKLVVLSACSTALGKQIRGEGLVGLVGGFFTAGSNGVVASYWNVDDESTSELMRRFYVNMFSEGMTPPAALRRAQNEIRSGSRFRFPYHFAAFEFHGYWR